MVSGQLRVAFLLDQITWFVVILVLAMNMSYAGEVTDRLSLIEEEDGITVLIDGELFTRYLISSGSRPAMWPIIGPTGEEMTRAFPIAAARKGEQKDHVHHRSLWIGYEGLNGNDYWHEKEKGVIRPFSIGVVRHRAFTTVRSEGESARIVAKNDWLDDDGKLVCTDTRTLQFGGDSDQRWIDCLIELEAAAGPLRIGDSKEGFFALRVAPTMRVDAGHGGQIVTSSGKVDAEAWSQRAEWVDYHGSIAGETVGIAVLCHPSSFEPAPRWHVRTYGLLAANPFGERAFTDSDSDVTQRPLKMTIPADESISFRYRVILHRGDAMQSRIAELNDRYSAEDI